MDEAAKRVNTVLDEYQKKREDFKLDAAIKIGGGATVGLTFGILTKKLIKIRRSVVAGSFIGLGMAVERYSQQLRFRHFTLIKISNLLLARHMCFHQPATSRRLLDSSPRNSSAVRQTNYALFSDLDQLQLKTRKTLPVLSSLLLKRSRLSKVQDCQTSSWCTYLTQQTSFLLPQGSGWSLGPRQFLNILLKRAFE